MISLLFERFLQLKTVNTVCNSFCGQAQVSVHSLDKNCLILSIQGTWIHSGIAYHDRLKITFGNSHVLLDHLRFDDKNPTKLVQLVPSSYHCLESLSPHLCGKDSYSAQMSWDDKEIRLLWVVIGPQKNEQIFHYFR